MFGALGSTLGHNFYEHPARMECDVKTEFLGFNITHHTPISSSHITLHLAHM